MQSLAKHGSHGFFLMRALGQHWGQFVALGIQFPDSKPIRFRGEIRAFLTKIIMILGKVTSGRLDPEPNLHFFALEHQAYSNLHLYAFVFPPIAFEWSSAWIGSSAGSQCPPFLQDVDVHERNCQLRQAAKTLWFGELNFGPASI